SKVISQLCAETPLPKMLRVRQLFDRERIAPEEIPGVMTERNRFSRGDVFRKSRRGITLNCNKNVF
ncbi:MAG: hypothetical protein LBG87_06460, partial [Spirochaetaceae bacterium]|nr:hypothetical protein [Spirochaetaceae bacterium]